MVREPIVKPRGRGDQKAYRYIGLLLRPISDLVETFERVGSWMLDEAVENTSTHLSEAGLREFFAE
jgi:hypothetical protein